MSGSLDWISHGIGKLSDSPLTNPNKIFGLDLWGREQPGGLIDRLENSVQDRTGLPTGTIGRYNQHYGPQTAGLILGSIFGGGALAGGGSGGSAGALDTTGFGSMFDSAGYPVMPPASQMMPAAVPETPATLSQWGMTETSPGVWDQTKGYTPSRGLQSFSQNNNGLGGQQGGMLQHKGAPPILMQMPEMVPVFPGVLEPFLRR